MDALLTLSWRAYPAGGLLALGLAVAVWGAYHGVLTAQREARDPRRALALLQGFRMVIIGLALAGIGAAWCWEIGWLLGLSMIIGGEELLESTVVITALRHAAHGVTRETGRSPISYIRDRVQRIPHAAPLHRPAAR